MALHGFFYRKREGTDSGSKAGMMTLIFRLAEMETLKQLQVPGLSIPDPQAETRAAAAPPCAASSTSELLPPSLPPERGRTRRGHRRAPAAPCAQRGGRARPRLQQRGRDEGSSNRVPTRPYAIKGREKRDKAAAATPGPPEPPRRAGPRGHMAAAPGHAQQGQRRPPPATARTPVPPRHQHPAGR